MAATLEQADRMLTAAQRHQICLMVNWPTAWSRPLHTAHRLVGEGAIGQLWQLTWRGGHCGPDELGCSDEFCGFLFDPQLNGAGAFNDYSGYGASLCVHFLGRPHSVVAMAGRLLKTHLPVDDNGIMVLRYPQALCRLEMTWTEAVSHVPSHDVVLYGTEGTLAVGESGDCVHPPEPDGGGGGPRRIVRLRAQCRHAFPPLYPHGPAAPGHDQRHPIAPRPRDYGSRLTGGYLGRGSEPAH